MLSSHMRTRRLRGAPSQYEPPRGFRRPSALHVGRHTTGPGSTARRASARIPQHVALAVTVDARPAGTWARSAAQSAHGYELHAG